MKFKDELLSRFMIRKKRNQKDEFFDWIKKNITEFDVKKEHHSMNTTNIVIGDVDKAKIIFTAHYDTCAVMPIPNFITPTNIFIYILYQLLLVVFLIGIPFVIASFVEDLFPSDGTIYMLIFDGLLFLMCYLMMFGPANKNTVNDNTSGVLTILEMIKKIPEELRDKVAFVLFDYEEVGLIGSSYFASTHKDIAKNKLVVNFDCVSDGDKVLFIFNNKAKKYKELFGKHYVDTDNVKAEVVKKIAIYPSDQANFKYGVGVCSVIRGKVFDYIDKIHTKKDTVLREENIYYLIDKSIGLIKDI